MDNAAVFLFIFGLSNHSFPVDTLMIFGARFIIYLTFLLMLIIFLKGGERERKSLFLALVTIPIIILLIKGIHLFFYEPRPFINFHLSPLIPHEEDASFPSRHTSIVSVIAFSYVYFKSKWAPIFLLLAIWVGLARIYVGVHYPLDIIGGFLLGLVALVITLQIKRLIKI